MALPRPVLAQPDVLQTKDATKGAVALWIVLSDRYWKQKFSMSYMFLQQPAGFCNSGSTCRGQCYQGNTCCQEAIRLPTCANGQLALSRCSVQMVSEGWQRWNVFPIGANVYKICFEHMAICIIKGMRHEHDLLKRRMLPGALLSHRSSSHIQMHSRIKHLWTRTSIPWGKFE